jgi:hypothetical protein
MKARSVYLRLLNEGTSVWRPVLAEPVDGNVYRIIEQPYARENEAWEFEPGSYVVCEWIRLSDGPVLAATRAELRR